MSVSVVHGVVDGRAEHFRITFGDLNKTNEPYLVALVARGDDDNTFLIDIKLDRTAPDAEHVIDQVEAQIRFYLVEKQERQPWKYARYHCGTGANLYSHVHWIYSGGTP